MTEEELRGVIADHPVQGTPAEMRAAFEALAARAPADLGGLTRGETRLGGLPCLTLTPTGGASGPPILLLHGGGYVFGSPRSHEGMAAVLAREASARVILPAYRLAPEHPWPAQREDALAVIGAMGGPYDLAGISAGGHLAIAACAAGARPRRLVLFSPNTNRHHERAPSRRTDGDAMNDHDTDERLARMAFGEVRPDDPDQTFGREQARSLPPTHIDVGTDEVLLDDSLRLASLAAWEGRTLDLHVREGWHMTQLFASRYGAGAESVARAGRWLQG